MLKHGFNFELRKHFLSWNIFVNGFKFFYVLFIFKNTLVFKFELISSVFLVF